MLKNLWNSLRTKSKEVKTIKGERCYLKPLVPQDANEVTRLLIDNQQFWSTHEPRHTLSYYTEYTQYNKLVESMRLRALNLEHFYGIYEWNENKLVGQISLYNVKSLPYSSCFIGYAIDERHTGKGITTEAVSLLMKFGFEEVKVNRIEAYVSPKNIASVRVLEKAGFKQEGLLNQLLYINGKWEDHYLYAIVFDQYKAMQ